MACVAGPASILNWIYKMLRGLREFQIRSTESCKKFHSPTKIICKKCILGKQSYLKPTDHICQVCKDFHLSNAQVFANISETFHKIFIYKYFAKISQLFTKLITNILQTFHNFSQTSGKHFTAFDKNLTNLGVLRCLLLGLRWPWLSCSRLEDSLSPHSTSSRNWFKALF